MKKHTKENYEKLLAYIKRPSRYIGSEYNLKLDRITKNKTKICLVFPELYEIAMSYLGIKILFHLLKTRKDIIVDIVFSPDIDLKELLKKNSLELVSLHNKIPLKEFDILGFSLSYELSYTNVLDILDMANIPIHSKKREENYPLIMGGGTCACNPEVMADFFDFFVLGDGEESILEVIDFIKKHQTSKKQELLLNLANSIDGIYVPSLYSIEYNDKYKISKIKKDPRLKKTPKKRIIKNLDKVFIPDKLLVPYINTTHDNFTVEIQRGCAWGCKFCQAGYINRPVRVRSKEVIEKTIRKGIKFTGYQGISLLSLSVIDHPYIESLLHDLSKEYRDKLISISLPSLRCDKFSVDIANFVSINKKSGLTFAPEAGSQRLRDFINKSITKEDIFEAIASAYNNGWKLIKLYFMYGLPTETQEDLQAIIDLIKEIKIKFKKLNLNIGISSFVPKPHTPFQWESQNTLDTLLEKKYFLLDGLKKYARVKHSREESRVVEGILARGDRRIGKLIETAWKLGACFDQWQEYFNFDIWEKASIEEGIDMNEYISRIRDYNEILPWDKIDFGSSKVKLIKTRETDKITKKIIKKRSTKKVDNKTKPRVERTTYKYRVKYKKTKLLKYLSHLEIVETIRKSLRRTGIDLVYSFGFHPLIKLSFSIPANVGVWGDSEFFDFNSYNHISTKELLNRMKKVFPIGLDIIEIKNIQADEKSLDKSIKYVIYKVYLNKNISEYSKLLEIYNKEKEWNLETKKGNKLNIKDIIDKIEINIGAETVLEVSLDISQKNIGIYKILNSIFSPFKDEILSLEIKRSLRF